MHPDKKCQSCGRPLKQDEKSGGTEADDTRSAKDCSHGNVGGEFTPSDHTAAQMQDRGREKMVAMGFPNLLTGFFTRGIPKLERWPDAR